MFVEVRLPVPIVASGSFRNFSWHCVVFPSEAADALGFVFSIWAKPNSKISLIRQNCLTLRAELFQLEIVVQVDRHRKQVRRACQMESGNGIVKMKTFDF